MKGSTHKPQLNLANFLWDLWCIVSVIGIWPRFIEPKLLSVTKLSIPLPNLPANLEGLKILQITDLHFNPHSSPAFLRKIARKIKALSPDLLVFTGDFLCGSQLIDPERLKNFLNSIDAKYGCYAILGNHDYAEYVSITSEGDYDLVKENKLQLFKGFRRLFTKIKLSGKMGAHVSKIPLHADLINLLKETPFVLLHNETKLIPIKGSFLNISGLGEYVLNRTLPQEAFKNYDSRFPGIVLTHNPDSVPKIINFPGEIILSGHTHGAQVNLPFFREKFTLMENMDLMRGLHKLGKKWLYVNRGVGGGMRFRWFSMPELLCLTLEKDSS